MVGRSIALRGQRDKLRTSNGSAGNLTDDLEENQDEYGNEKQGAEPHDGSGSTFRRTTSKNALSPGTEEKDAVDYSMNTDRYAL